MTDFSDREIRENRKKAADWDHLVSLCRDRGFNPAVETLESWLMERLGLLPANPVLVLWYDMTYRCTECADTWSRQEQYAEGVEPHPGELSTGRSNCANGHRSLPVVYDVKLVAEQEGVDAAETADAQDTSDPGPGGDDTPDAGADLPDPAPVPSPPDAPDVHVPGDPAPAAGEGAEPRAGASDQAGVSGGDDPGSPTTEETP